MRPSPGFLAAWMVLLAAAALPTAAGATSAAVVNLVTDDQTANAAQTTDTALVNAWGISSSASSPFWVSDNGTGVSTLYKVDPSTNATTKQGLAVTIPGAGNVTGQTFNPNSASAFNGDLFLFASEDGTISGWRGSLGSSAETLQVGSAENSYKGIALAAVVGHSYLYAANFATGSIDVLKGDAAAPDLAGHFTDPNLPSGYAPFNIAHIGSSLFVTYAVVGQGGDDVAGAGNGIVNEFNLQGSLIRRFATGDVLNSPWGMAIAPAAFGTPLAGKLLVGNFGDGKINAFDVVTAASLGALTGTNGQPIVIDGLWGLANGNGGNGGSTDALYFSAGPGGEVHGLFGALVPVPEPGDAALLGFGLAALGLVRRHRPD